MVTQITDIIVDQTIEDEEFKFNCSYLKEILVKNFLSFIFLLYLCGVIVEKSVVKNFSEALISLDILFVLKIYRRLKQIYVVIKIKIPSFWRN